MSQQAIPYTARQPPPPPPQELPRGASFSLCRCSVPPKNVLKKPLEYFGVIQVKRPKMGLTFLHKGFGFFREGLRSSSSVGGFISDGHKLFSGMG